MDQIVRQETKKWKINNEDAADIFGALYKGLIKEVASDKTHSALINDWLISHPHLEQKYRGPNFHRNFVCNFRHVVNRFNKWKQDSSEYHYNSVNPLLCCSPF